MTQFEHLELIYNQFFNLADEIQELIEKEDYSEAIVKLKYKDKLIKKLFSTKKTVKFTDEEAQKVLAIEQKIKEKEQSNIERLMGLQGTIGAELRSNRKKIKVNSAYEIPSDERSGSMLDVSE